MSSAHNVVLLVNTNRMRPVVAPIAVDYLGTSLQQHGYRVAVLDLALSNNPLESIEEEMKRTKPLAIGITIRNTDDCYFSSRDFFLPEVRRIVHAIKGRTDAPVILGGCGFSIMPVAILEYCGCDIGIRGDGEIPLLRFLDAWSEKTSRGTVPGLVYRTDNGWHMNPPAYLPMDGFPPQKRDAVDNRRYLIDGGMGNIETKRGCDRGCIYCADPVAKGRLIRARNPRAVVDEVEALVNQGVDVLHTCDSEFNLPSEHATAVCEEIVRRELGNEVRWYSYMSPKPFTATFASLLKRAGCAGINFGVDSGNETMLKRLGRDFSAQDILDTARICRAHSIPFMFDLLLGGPGETKRTVAETIGLMRHAEPERVGTAIGIRVYPGTGLASVVESEGPSERNQNLHGETSNNPMFLKPVFYLSEKLGENAVQFVGKLVQHDERFFVSVPEATRQNYNYNENQVLVEAIRKGYRGAFWDILRRLPQDRRLFTGDA